MNANAENTANTETITVEQWDEIFSQLSGKLRRCVTSMPRSRAQWLIGNPNERIIEPVASVLLGLQAGEGKKMEKGVLAPRLVLSSIWEITRGYTIVDYTQEQSALLRSLLTVLRAGIAIKATPPYKVADCMHKNVTYGSYPGDDSWLAQTLPFMPGGAVTVHKLTGVGVGFTFTFKEMAEALLGTTGSLEKIQELLIERKKTVSLLQTHELIERTIAGEENILLTNGYHNFFFWERKKEVVPVEAFLSGDHWYIHISWLSHGNRWCCGHSLVSRD